MRRWWLGVFLVACGGGGDDTDGGIDATADQSKTDAKLDVVKDTTIADAKGDADASPDAPDDATADAPDDATADAPDDATMDAPDDADDAADADDGASDAGADVIFVDGGICGLCAKGTVCCTIPKAIDYGKCYNPACLACCQ